MAKKKKARGRKKTGMKRKAATTKKTKAKKGGGLNAISTAALAVELRRRQQGVQKLLTKRNRLAGQLVEVEAQITACGGAVGGMGRKRPRNVSNLADALVKTLKNKTMGVTEVAEAVQAGGYRTTSANFRTIVNQTLLREKKRIKKVSRGRYTAA